MKIGWLLVKIVHFNFSSDDEGFVLGRYRPGGVVTTNRRSPQSDYGHTFTTATIISPDDERYVRRCFSKRVMNELNK